MLHGSPWVYTYSHCHQMFTQHRPKGPGDLSEVTEKSQFPANPCQPKNG